ncbi:hypothetical protein [Moumouvirus maliensis]|nr:hypothetical protein [Moumouvirus maliensis]
MIIISWDVGVIHLAYCILEYIYNSSKKTVTINILDWDEINLIEDERINISCCGKMKNGNHCNKKATYYLNINDNTYGYCKTHLLQYNEIWSHKDTEKLFKKINTNNKCDFVKNTGNCCEKNSTHIFKNKTEKKYYCNVHFKSELKKKIKEYSPQPIKNMIVKKFPTSQLQFNLVKKLDELSEHFAKLKIQEVVIENQPSQKNPKMKSIANTLFDYFMIRGYVDKIHNMDIQLVRFMCPSNKLKVNNDNTLEVFKANKDSKKKYKLTKNLSIEYTRKLLSNDQSQLDYLSLHQKEDDMCDAYLQGRYYLEFIKFKENNLKFNSKTIKSIKKTKSKKNESTKKSPKKVKIIKNIESVKKIKSKKNNVIVL